MARASQMFKSGNINGDSPKLGTCRPLDLVTMGHSCYLRGSSPLLQSSAEFVVDSIRAQPGVTRARRKGRGVESGVGKTRLNASRGELA